MSSENEDLKIEILKLKEDRRIADERRWDNLEEKLTEVSENVSVIKATVREHSTALIGLKDQIQTVTDRNVQADKEHIELQLRVAQVEKGQEIVEQRHSNSIKWFLGLASGVALMLTKTAWDFVTRK